MMRKCYASAIVLIAWYLMLPPPVFPPIKDAAGNYQVNSAAPISQWIKYKTLRSEGACKARLKQMEPFYRCVKSDDPALKPSAEAASAPAAAKTQ